MKQNARIKGLAISYIYYIANTILSIFIAAFIIRKVGNSNYGVYQSITAFVTYLVLLEFGTGTLMTRNLSLLKKDKDNELKIKKNISTIWTLSFILSALICVFIVVFYILIPYIYKQSFTPEQVYLGKQLFIISAINLIFTFLTTTLNGLILAYEHYIFEKTFALVKLIARTVLLISLLSFINDVKIVVFIDLILSIVCFLATLVFCVKKIKVRLSFKYFDKEVFRNCLPLAFALLLQTFVNVANGIVDKFLISVMMTPESVSIYSVTTTFFNAFSSVSTIPITIFMPSIAKHVRNGLRGFDLTKKLVNAAKLNTFLIGIILFGFIVVGREFISVIYGPEFVEAWFYALLIMVPMFFNYSNAVIINVLDLYNKRHFRSLILLFATTLNIIITIFGIKYSGMVGAALGTCIATIFQVVILNIYYAKHIKLNIVYLFKECFKGLIVSLVFSTLLTLPILNRIDNQLIRLLVGVLVFLGAFATYYWILGVSKEMKPRIKTFFREKFKKH